VLQDELGVGGNVERPREVDHEEVLRLGCAVDFDHVGLEPLADLLIGLVGGDEVLGL
jgi:hypothetical protein